MQRALKVRINHERYAFLIQKLVLRLNGFKFIVCESMLDHCSVIWFRLSKYVSGISVLVLSLFNLYFLLLLHRLVCFSHFLLLLVMFHYSVSYLIDTLLDIDELVLIVV